LRRIFGVYAIRIFQIKMPHKTDTPKQQVGRGKDTGFLGVRLGDGGGPGRGGVAVE